MSDLSLRQYLKKVEALLESGHLEEGKAQARHILSYYPKNRDAYLLLGRILIAQRHWQEAAEVLRRLLGADPLNGTAHQLLSQAYLQMFQLDSALFHLERAFDQTPNDRQIITGLRELYSRIRGKKVEKIQLTAGAVAGQYLSNNLPDQAIDILRKASQRFPERVDLKLMLALSYQAAERHIEAAEAAVEVLKSLPFALQANRIVAEFWLAQQRPSDARLNIVRIEEVDPYYAQQIVTGKVDENRYTLPELDYKRLAEREMAAADPDWLSTLSRSTANVSSAEAFGDDLAWLMDDMSNQMAGAASGSALTTTSEDPSDAALEDTGGLRPEVIERLEALKHAANHGAVISSAAPPLELTSSDLAGLEAMNPLDLSSDWMKEVPPFPEAELRSEGFTGLLSSLGSGGEDETWMRDVLSGGGPTEPVAAQTPDNLDFLADIGIRPPISPQSDRVSTGFTDFITPVEAVPSSPTDSDQSLEDFFRQIETTEDPLDLQYRAASFLDELEYDDSAEVGFSSQVVSVLDEERVSGMSLNQVDYVPDPTQPDFFQQLEYSESEEDPAVIAPNTVGELRSEWAGAAEGEDDPLAWMRAAEIEYDENAVDPFAAAAALDESGLMAPTEVPQDPLAWARQQNVEVEADQDEDPLAWMKQMGLESAEPPQEHDKLGAALDMKQLATDELPAYIEAKDAGEGQTTMTDNSNWLDDDPDDFDWLSEEALNDEDDVQAAAADLNWLEEPPSAEELSSKVEPWTGFTSMLDRLEPTAEASDDLSWMEKFNTNYLASESRAGAYDLDAIESSLELSFESFDLEDEPADALDPSFEASVSDGADWLDAVGEQADVASLDEEPTAAEDFGFIDEADFASDNFNFHAVDDEVPADEFGFDEKELEAFGLPDAELSDEAAAMVDFGFSSQGEAGAEGFGFNEEELEAFGLPDAELSDEAAAMVDFDFTSEGEAAAEGFGFDEEELTEQPIAASEFDFTGGTDFVSGDLDAVLYRREDADFGFNTEEMDAFAGDVQSASAHVDAYDESFDVEDSADQFDWFSTDQPAAAQDEPDWLGAIQIGSELNEADFTLDDEEEVLDEGFAAANLPTVAAAEEETTSSSDELTADNIAVNAPDWLNSMVPGMDVDYENLTRDELIEEEFMGEGSHRPRAMEGFDAVNEGYDWLEELVEEESRNIPAVSALPVVPLPPVPDFSRMAEPQRAPAAVKPPVTRAFVFSSLPPWVDRLRAALGGAAPAAERDEFDDFDFDDDDLK